METENRFPNKLREIRKNRGLKQIEVAQMLGLTSTDRISHWEKRLASPGIINLFKLSVLYDIPVEQLYADLYEVIKKEMNNTNGPKSG